MVRTGISPRAQFYLHMESALPGRLSRAISVYLNRKLGYNPVVVAWRLYGLSEFLNSQFLKFPGLYIRHPHLPTISRVREFLRDRNIILIRNWIIMPLRSLRPVRKFHRERNFILICICVIIPLRLPLPVANFTGCNYIVNWVISNGPINNPIRIDRPGERFCDRAISIEMNWIINNDRANRFHRTGISRGL